ncbi:MAG TPA: MEDS domain-containing protein [Candidatus Dormibacteraeota bacterium]|nr:MEDS domain-containing protein [Candidatus Dormibacteraeota bacterium]
MPSLHPAKTHEIYPSASPTTGHAVQFYECDSSLIEVLGSQLGLALEAGDTVIVIATRKHRDGLREGLASRNSDFGAAAQAGRYREFDASECLRDFMVDGSPDKTRFEKAIGLIVERAEAEVKPGHRLVLFGEMVALLWAEGKEDATVRLEQLWNDLAQRHSFHLLCGYPISAFDRSEHRRLFFNICGEHTHINPAESYPERGSENQRRRSVVRLQQKAEALETEIRISQQRLRLLQKVTKAGSWELDIVSDLLSFSSAAAKLLGYESASQIRLSQLMDLMYYSGDREAVAGHLQAAQRHRTDFTTTFRIRLGEDTRIIQIQGKTFYNSGSPIMLGVFTDVTPAVA